MIRAVLDANVFVSAVLTPRGPAGQILRAWQDAQFQLAVSVPIVQEIERVLQYPKIARRHRWSGKALREFIDDLAHLAILTPGELSLRVINEDPADNRYLECAVEGEAQYLVSGDEHLVRLGTYQEVRIVRPAAFVEILRVEAARGEHS